MNFFLKNKTMTSTLDQNNKIDSRQQIKLYF
jgi:hypothetical protein